MRFRPLVFVALALLSGACAPTPSAGSTVPTTSLSPSSVPAATTATPSPSKAATTAATLPSQPASRATATLSTSAGKVVDLGVEFSTAAQINATAWLASDAKTFLVGQLELAQQEYRISGDGNDCGVLTVSGYRVADLISGAEFGTGESNCGGGGADFLWGKIAGQWRIVVSGQDVPVCSRIRNAGWTSTIPKEFFGGQCMEKDGPVIYTP